MTTYLGRYQTISELINNEAINKKVNIWHWKMFYTCGETSELSFNTMTIQNLSKRYLGYLIACPLSIHDASAWHFHLVFGDILYTCSQAFYQQRCQMCYMALICEFNHSVLLKWEQHWPLAQVKGIFCCCCWSQYADSKSLAIILENMKLTGWWICFLCLCNKCIWIQCLFHSLVVCPWQQIGYFLLTMSKYTGC